MYKHFQAGNAKTICDKLNESKMKIHSIEQTNGMFHCIAEKSEDEREIRCLGGSVLQVTKNLNSHGRVVEGKVIMKGHAATAFYRFDEKMESKMQAELDKAAKEAKEASEKAEKAAKKADMLKKMEELKAEMAKVDSGLTDSQKEEKEEKAKADKVESARKSEMAKVKSKSKKEDK